MTKYKITIQAYHGRKLTGVSILNLLKNHDHIMDEIQELCVDAINNRANNGHTLLPPTVEEFDNIPIPRDLFEAPICCLCPSTARQTYIRREDGDKEKDFINEKVMFRYGFVQNTQGSFHI